MVKVLLIVLMFNGHSGVGSPSVTNMESMSECQSARTAILAAFPYVETDFTHGESGIRPELISCIEYSIKVGISPPSMELSK
jgi:hypothetical protein